MYLNIRKNIIHYTSYGNGPELIFCLHGYGESGESFAYLGEKLGDRFTLVCPDLPLHGKTDWIEETFEPTDLDAIFIQLADTFNRREPFVLAGFSMGGRLAVAFTEKYPTRIKRLFLIASDGLKENTWYWLATQTKSGNQLFRSTMKNPRWLFSMMDVALQLKLLNLSYYKFTHLYLDDAVQRNDLYARWTLFRKFRPSIKKFQAIIRRYKIPILIFCGAYDRIIPSAQASSLLKGAGINNRLIILETGHRLLKPPHVASVAKNILQSLPE
jgi:pimeloyl-ACP methyl ester carboxylesterase